MGAGVDGDLIHRLKPTDSNATFKIVNPDELKLKEMSAEAIAEWAAKLPPVSFTVTIDPLPDGPPSIEDLKWEIIKKLKGRHPNREVDIQFVQPGDK